MNKLSNILTALLSLLADALLLTWGTARHIILPGRSRRGNILSSLLSFFVGLAERVQAFETKLFARSFLAHNKYIRQGLVLAAWLLFLVSSVEWSLDRPLRAARGPATPVPVAVQTVAAAPAAAVVNLSPRTMALAGDAGDAYACAAPLCQAAFPGATKRYLLIRVLRL